MQIRSRLTIQFFLITAALLLLSLLSIYYFSVKIQKDEFYSTLETRANTTADLLIRVEQVDSTLLKLIDLNKKDVLDYENISVYDSNQKEIYSNNDTIHFSNILPDLEGFLNDVSQLGEKQVTIDDIDIIGVQYLNKNKKFVVVACAIDTKGLHNLHNLRRILTSVFVTILAIIGIAGWIFSGRALRPISHVINQVNNISANNLNIRIDEGNNKDEIARLIMTFNDLLNRIEHAFTTQKLFVSNASHELRNPLTAITAQLEVSLLKMRTAEEYERIITSVLDDIKRLNEMSHRLLTLAKMDKENVYFQLQPMRFDDLVWEAKRDFMDQQVDCKASLTLPKLPENENDLKIKGNSQFLKICFLNLMDNACKFSPDRSVDIELFCEEKNIGVHFSDHGIGIEDNDLQYIFEPFFRGKNSGDVNGFGVGLSIVEKIVRMHNGKIQIVSELNKGTTITLLFPLI